MTFLFHLFFLFIIFLFSVQFPVLSGWGLFSSFSISLETCWCILFLSRLFFFSSLPAFEDHSVPFFFYPYDIPFLLSFLLHFRLAHTLVQLYAFSGTLGLEVACMGSSEGVLAVSFSKRADIFLVQTRTRTRTRTHNHTPHNSRHAHHNHTQHIHAGPFFIYGMITKVMMLYEDTFSCIGRCGQGGYRPNAIQSFTPIQEISTQRGCYEKRKGAQTSGQRQTTSLQQMQTTIDS
jgi:hypothetical protein